MTYRVIQKSEWRRGYPLATIVLVCVAGAAVGAALTAVVGWLALLAGAPFDSPRAEMAAGALLGAIAGVGIGVLLRQTQRWTVDHQALTETILGVETLRVPGCEIQDAIVREAGVLCLRWHEVEIRLQRNGKGRSLLLLMVEDAAELRAALATLSAATKTDGFAARSRHTSR